MPDYDIPTDALSEAIARMLSGDDAPDQMTEPDLSLPVNWD